MSNTASTLLPSRTAMLLVLAGIGLLLLTVASGRPTPGALTPGETLPMPQERALRFTDTADGCIVVSDAGSAVALETLCGEQGFLRGVLRTLVHERSRAGLAPREAPFVLRAQGGSRLSIGEAQGGRPIELDSFGPSNRAVFARWLPAPHRP
jgi:putative photosynthetic complex assembly protein